MVIKMQSFQIEEVKSFMSKLLYSDMFDLYLLSEAQVTTYQTFQIDGHINRDFYKEMEPSEEESYFLESGYSTWKHMRPFCFDLIKGKRTPLSFKFILVLPSVLAHTFLEPMGASSDLLSQKTCFLNIRYDGSKLTCVTATSSNDFQLEKDTDRCWDQYLERFLKENNISYLQ